MNNEPTDQFSEHNEDLQVRAGIATRRPWGFCVTKDSACTMNYCDDNGCIDGKPKHDEGECKLIEP